MGITIDVRVKNLIITGSPGTGKTTLIKECVNPFRDCVGGFYTEEMREGAVRKGFYLKTLEGASGILAAKGLKSKHRLNKYGVDLHVLEDLGAAAIEKAIRGSRVVVVDEIGTMEMMSSLFCEKIASALISPKPLLATIRLKAEPFTSQIKKMSDTLLLKLDRENFLEMKAQVRQWLEAKCRS